MIAGISLVQSQLPSYSYFQEESDQCLADNTFLNASTIDTIEKGINCSYKESATVVNWSYYNSQEKWIQIICNDNIGTVNCNSTNGSATLYVEFGINPPEGIYRCCFAQEECKSVRIYTSEQFNTLFINGELFGY